jgi:hypothetical protein
MLLGVGVTLPSDDIEADQFHRYFDDRLAGMPSATADARCISGTKPHHLMSTSIVFNH